MLYAFTQRDIAKAKHWQGEVWCDFIALCFMPSNYVLSTQASHVSAQCQSHEFSLSLLIYVFLIYSPTSDDSASSASAADRAALPIKSGPWTRATIAAEFGLRLRDVRLLDPSFANQVRAERAWYSDECHTTKRACSQKVSLACSWWPSMIETRVHSTGLIADRKKKYC